MTTENPIEIDTRPGFYYVSCRRDTDKGPEYRLLRGPFPTHQEAHDALPDAIHEAHMRDPRSVFYAFGTARSAIDQGPGILDRPTLQKYHHGLGEPIAATGETAA